MISPIIVEDLEEIISEFRDNLRTLEGKKILVTGGNGFIPSYLVDAFARFNREIAHPMRIIVMNKHPVTKESRLSHLLGNANVSMIAQDVGKCFEVPKSDIIVHAASRANPAFFMKDPIDTIEANVNGAITLLNYCKKNPVDNFLFFSSGEVYGDNPPLEFIPTPETYAGSVDPNGKKACYAESKRFVETLCSSAHRQYGTPTKILRLFHTYGPGLRDDGKAITDFFNQARERKQIKLKDGGGARIAFGYVSDAVRGILKVMFNGKSGEPYNIGEDYKILSIRYVAETIAQIMENGTTVKMDESEPVSANISVRWPNIDKLRALGYFPRTGLEEGLRRMKMHYDSS